MAYVLWCDMFSIKVTHIDNQHQHLFNIVNRFFEALKNKQGDQILFETLNELIRYAEMHFRDEEKLMTQAKYPEKELQEHKKLHENLVEEIFNLQKEYSHQLPESLYHTEVFMNNWLIKHILDEDKKLVPFCKLLTNFRP